MLSVDRGLEAQESCNACMIKEDANTHLLRQLVATYDPAFTNCANGVSCAENSFTAVSLSHASKMIRWNVAFGWKIVWPSKCTNVVGNIEWYCTKRLGKGVE